VAYSLAQKISGNAKTVITNISPFVTGKELATLSLCNIHATDSVSVDLYITSQATTDITTTGVYAAETEAASISSVTLTIDNGSGSASAGTSDMFLDEKVYKSDGTLFGTCTTFGGTTSLTFSGGLSNTITDNDILFTGTRYYALKGVVIPVNTTLVLSRDEFRVDPNNYLIYIKLSAADGAVDVITRK